MTSKAAWWVGGAIAFMLLALFGSVIIGAILTSGSPPVLSDPAPKNRPKLLCLSETKLSEVGKSDPTTTTTKTPKPTGSPTSGATNRSGKSRKAPGKAKSAAVLTVPCKADQLVLSPQLRGAYDVNARLIGLLAVVAPLITTIVAFFFGARAGAGQAGTDLAKMQVREAELKNNLEPDLVEKLKNKGLIS